MPKIEVSFEVTASSGIAAYWIAVGSKHIPLVNGKGALPLDTGTRPTLVWWMTGNPGESISVRGASSHQVVVEVKESRIPNGEIQGAGVRRFNL